MFGSALGFPVGMLMITTASTNALIRSVFPDASHAAMAIYHG
jgi:hypothetical protein